MPKEAATKSDGSGKSAEANLPNKADLAKERATELMEKLSVLNKPKHLAKNLDMTINQALE